MPGPEPATPWFGGDYNPEQWPEAVWHEDMELMRRAGVTLATVGVFSWSLLEPREGEYDFAWLDRVLDLLHANGVGAALATPTASPPPWFTLAHPGAMPVSADGVRLTHGSRDTYDVCAPAYRAASVRIARALAERYARHPALRLWHVHNEYGTHSHGEHAADAFRVWLRERHGTLEALNEAWTTAFWGQRYSAWEQVRPPRATQYLRNPAHVLDFRRFLSDAMLAHYRAQRDVLRAASPGVPVTTNFAFGGWVPVDQWKWASELDLVAIDHYPDAPGGRAAEQGAFAADLARSWAGDRPWLLMEQATGYTGPAARPKAPGEIARHSVGHVARGSLGALFFQWRASRGGAEQWHPAMLPHTGPDSRVFAEVCGLGALLPRLAGALGADVAEDAAVVWDPECWWALDAATPPAPDLDYAGAVRQIHRVLRRQGRTAAFAAPGARPPDLPLLVAPMMYLASDATARELAGYVERGGTLVATYLSGTVDEHARVRAGGYAGALRGLLGVRVEEFHPLDGGGAAVAGADGAFTGRARRWSEHVRLAGAEAVARYAGGPLDGLPAVTRAAYGAGSAWYVSADLDDDALAAVLAAAAPPARPAPPEGVEVVRRRGNDGGWVFVLNHGTDSYTVDPAVLGLPRDARDAVSDAPADGLSVPPGGIAALRR
ncbi:beta-galactosidase [Actinorugispora endophytica]|uniref:Beta-galactosidase n=1 Tax=Actinorugispora endophytica TaxID=1605990 RepID=A0A4R6UTV2_9ACTN|nr:beta-galactosidase [Actinorugispora endophytica]TDQ50778.1 beta-galactosidase [Actinorugispora endophytica]